MKHPRLLLFGAMILTAMGCSIGANPLAAQAKPVPGKLAGVVRDVAGTPQMGATVEVMAESTGLASALGYLTNPQGIFKGEKLSPGFYTVRVTLAGFLPNFQQHVHISSNLTTVLRIQLESMFASLDQLRRQPINTGADPDDWKWVLRSAASMRPALEWMEDDDTITASTVSTDAGRPRSPRALLDFTDGGRHLASPSNEATAPATAFAYEQKLGGVSRLLLAGQVSYDEDTPAGGIAAIWLPTGTLGAGPHTALVLREAKLSPVGPGFSGVRIDQGGTLTFGDRADLHYGGEYVLVGLGESASALRPRAQLDVRVAGEWHAALIFASMPNGSEPLEAGGQDGGVLASALNELDAFPALMWHGGHPVLQGGWHEEISAEHKMGSRAKLQIAAFHDDNSHVAVYGRGVDLPTAEFFQDYLSNAFAYDGGSSSSWGARVALREKIGDNIEITSVYAFAGALVPTSIQGAEDVLRDMLRTAPRQSVGANVSAKVPRLHTKVNAGYKWVDGIAVSRVDLFGESLFQMDPFLHVGFRQPLPKFALGHWEAVADCDNLLAQGYVPFNSRDGHLLLVPAFRTFRGGLSVQF